ncbi:MULTISPECIES: hypothetical protein [unclassified Streptomyces]|uniref:hypothetical protein n=1 Tax=unclassified Streptomyces TaxID=2593676 RepID=UPI003631985E
MEARVDGVLQASPTGAAADLVELLRRSWPYARAPVSPVRAHEDCAGEPAVVR